MATLAAPASSSAVSAAPPSSVAPPRLLTLDVFRGLTMILLVSHSFGLIEALKNSQSFLAAQVDHAAWVGCTLWDLIQPAFTFIVGAAMPFALERRRREGHTRARIFGHVLWRAALLVLLSNILSNWGAAALRLQFINVLCQIAFGYVLCYLLLQLPFRAQVAAAAALLIGHQALFFLFPGPAGPFDQTANVGAAVDLRLLGYNYFGHYTTLNFLGNAVTIVFGAWTGLLFQRTSTHRGRLRILIPCAAAAFASGWLLSSWIPMVKRLWTASFTLFSTGWVLLAFAALYAILEIRDWKRWAFPAVVVGANSIFIYSFSQVLRGWLSRGLASFTGHFSFLGPWGEVPHNLLVLSVMWYLCYWLYQRRIFFRI